jgi:hypothetical protein
MGKNLTLKDELHIRCSARSVDTPPLTDCAPFYNLPRNSGLPATKVDKSLLY